MGNSKFISCIIITRNRKKDLEECIYSILEQDYDPFEIIIIDNNSEDGTGDIFHGEFLMAKKIQYIRLNENKGVAGGRNEGIKLAKGDICIFIDDDAIFSSCDSFNKVVEEFERNSGLGILAFKSCNYYTKQLHRYEFPHIDKTIDPDKRFETSYFVGVGHAIKTEVFKKIGVYPEDYVYGGEELDLSFRVLNAGYKIMYLPDVTVLHKKSLGGRFQKSFEKGKMFENRIKTSIRNLPWKYVFINIITFMALVILKHRVNPLIFIKPFMRLSFNLSTLLSQRKVVNKETIIKLKQLKGRLYY